MKFILLLLLAGPVFALEQSYQYPDFEAAEKAESFLKFTLEHTRVGLFSSDFYGYVKSFQASAQLENNEFSDMSIRFAALSVDTDNGMRNDNMYEDVLAAKEHPQIRITALQSCPLNTDCELPAIVQIRGKDQEIRIKVKIVDQGESYQVAGKSELSVKGLGLPDPSIAIASLRDRIDVDFQFEMKKGEIE